MPDETKPTAQPPQTTQVSPGVVGWRFFPAVFFSRAADTLAMTAITVWLVQNHSPSHLVAFLIADLLPGILFAQLGGKLLDSRGAKYLWPISLVGQGLAYAALIGHVNFWSVLVAVTVASTLAHLAGAAATVYAQSVVADADRTMVVQRMQAGNQISGVVGVIAGAAIFAQVGIVPIVVINAVSFAAFAVVAWWSHWSLPGRVPEPSNTAKTTRIWATLWGPGRVAKSTVWLIFAVVFGTSLEGVVGAFYFLQTLAFTEVEYSFTNAIWTVGIIATSIIFAARTLTTSPKLFAASALAMGVSLAVVVLPLGGPIAVCVVFLAGGFGNGLFNMVMVTHMAERVPVADLGRAWGCLAVVINTGILVGHLGGTLTSGNTYWVGMLLAGLVPILAAGVVGIRMLRQHRVTTRR